MGWLITDLLEEHGFYIAGDIERWPLEVLRELESEVKSELARHEYYSVFETGTAIRDLKQALREIRKLIRKASKH